MITTSDAADAALDPTRLTEEADMIDGLRALIYHRVPPQVCYALARADIRSLDHVRAQTRDQLLSINRIDTAGITYIERALAAIDAAEAEDAIAREVYGCRAGRECRIATEQQRETFEPMIAARLAGWRAGRTPRSRG